LPKKLQIRWAIQKNILKLCWEQQWWGGNKMTRYLRWVFPLTLLYIALTTNFEPRNWVLGGLLAVGITALLRPDPAPIQWRNLPTALLAMAQFLLTLIWSLLVSSLSITRLILQREMPLQQGVFALPSGSSSPLVTWLSAHAITLTPGELVLEMDEENTLYVHSLNMDRAVVQEPIAQARRVQQLEKIF
jgi:multicomponent Na+:H+ antiporter subunit E